MGVVMAVAESLRGVRGDGETAADAESRRVVDAIRFG